VLHLQSDNLVLICVLCKTDEQTLPADYKRSTILSRLTFLPPSTLQLHEQLPISTMDRPDSAGEQPNQSVTKSHDVQLPVSVASDTTTSSLNHISKLETPTHEAQNATNVTHQEQLDEVEANSNRMEYAPSTTAHSYSHILAGYEERFGAEGLYSFTPPAGSDRVYIPQQRLHIPVNPISLSDDIRLGDDLASFTPLGNTLRTPQRSSHRSPASPSRNETGGGESSASQTLKPSEVHPSHPRTVFQEAESRLAKIDFNKAQTIKVDHSLPIDYDENGRVKYDPSVPYSFGNRNGDRGPDAYYRENDGRQPDIWAVWICHGSDIAPDCRAKNLLPFPPRKYQPYCCSCLGSMFMKATTKQNNHFFAR
jgi:hypothetical protein